MTGESVWLVFAGIATWPAAAVVLVLIVMLFARPEQRGEVLRALAEVVRAVRGTAEQIPVADRSAGCDHERPVEAQHRGHEASEEAACAGHGSVPSA